MVKQFEFKKLGVIWIVLKEHIENQKQKQLLREGVLAQAKNGDNQFLK